MSNSDLLQIFGIVISVLFGLWGIYAVRKNKHPASINFVWDQSISLLEDFAKKIPNLSVLYKELPIDKSIILISGSIVNVGAIDISREMTEQALTCKLPNGCKWLELKLTSLSTDLDVRNKIISEDCVEFSLGLFRCNEFFSFQALVLLNDDNSNEKASKFADKLIWPHRISGLGQIKTIQMPPEPKVTKTKIWFKRVIVGCGSILYLFLGLITTFEVGPLLFIEPRIIYQVDAGKSLSTVSLRPRSNGTTTITNIKTGKIEEVVLKQYTKDKSLIPIWSDTRERSLQKILIGIPMIIFSFFIFYAGFSGEYKRYRLRKLVIT